MACSLSWNLCLLPLVAARVVAASYPMYFPYIHIMSSVQVLLVVQKYLDIVCDENCFIHEIMVEAK